MLQFLKIAVNFTRDCGMVSINLPVFKIITGNGLKKIYA